MKGNIGIFLVLGILSACSSIKSIQNPGAESAAGLSYYMPNKDFLVQITVVKDDKDVSSISEVTLGVTPSYPDLSTQYVLKHDSNWLGKNTLNVGVGTSGLLSSATSTTVSQVNEAFKNLAGSLGRVAGMDLLLSEETEPDKNCKEAKTYTFTYTGTRHQNPCGLRLTIEAIGSHANIRSAGKSSGKEHSGIFYRQSLPYRMTAKGPGVDISSIVFSPSESKTHFLPISKTFFANNKAEFTFNEGVPVKFMQDTDGELIGFFKLPADIIAAYFAAIGSVFDSLKSNDEKEAAALAQSLKLELAKQKYLACMAAIRNKDQDAIKALACNQ